jgi:hypothetical protein
VPKNPRVPAPSRNILCSRPAAKALALHSYWLNARNAMQIVLG